ncbi:retroviral-like aspartic protease family protein [Pseudoalteromonas sp. 5Ae-yellow]|uniref:retroviral-like aspartic protease family protein n=1 Tax=Pseudoalteromonas sp. 5Ae-yellow TaxID=2759847 RepID=UPI0015F70FB4|nr:retroviral-like aspartic protease family protein [Pseudoalteromonas sp. 5Ae-yellow]MBA6409008.1 retroviral-like aspartic protease family protein [Pseudoalteromonas sp. 5Ae-yellow]
MSHYAKLITLLLIGSLSLNAYLLWPQPALTQVQKTQGAEKSISPKQQNTLLNTAKQQFKQHQFEAALSSYEQLKNSNPESAKNLYSSWLVQLKIWLNSNLLLSESFLNALLNNSPYNVELLNLQVEYLINSEQTQNAIIALFELNSLLPAHQQNNENIRLNTLTQNELHTLTEQQNWQAIIEQTQIWLDYKSDNAQFLYPLAYAYYQQGDLISAQATLDRMPNQHNLKSQVQTLQAMINKAQSQDDFVALTPYGAHYLINSEINNNLSTELMIDTGASVTSLPTNIIEQISPQPLYLGDVTVNTANGRIVVKRYQIESFKVGSQIIYGFEVLSIENTRGQGLLGMNFLSRFKFNINQQTDELELSAK